MDKVAYAYYAGQDFAGLSRYETVFLALSAMQARRLTGQWPLLYCNERLRLWLAEAWRMDVANLFEVVDMPVAPPYARTYWAWPKLYALQDGQNLVLDIDACLTRLPMDWEMTLWVSHLESGLLAKGTGGMELYRNIAEHYLPDPTVRPGWARKGGVMEMFNTCVLGFGPGLEQMKQAYLGAAQVVMESGPVPRERDAGGWEHMCLVEQAYLLDLVRHYATLPEGERMQVVCLNDLAGDGPDVQAVVHIGQAKALVQDDASDAARHMERLLGLALRFCASEYSFLQKMAKRLGHTNEKPTLESHANPHVCAQILP